MRLKIGLIDAWDWRWDDDEIEDGIDEMDRIDEIENDWYDEIGDEIDWSLGLKIGLFDEIDVMRLKMRLIWLID